MACGCVYIFSQNKDRASSFRCPGTNKAPGTEIKCQGGVGTVLLFRKMILEILKSTNISGEKKHVGKFPGCLVVRIQCCYYGGLGSIPGQGTIPYPHWQDAAKIQ